MKSFVFFIILNVLTLFTHAQDQTTCEQEFSLQGETCTPCQQVLFKHKATDIETTPNKCLVLNIFRGHMSENTIITPGTPPPDEITKIKLALDKTCAETANNACKESTTKSIYTEIDKACDAEINQFYSTRGTNKKLTPSEKAGLLAATSIALYYTAIPLRENMCAKVENEYCLAKAIEQVNQTQIQDPFTVLQCDECTNQFYNNLKSYQLSHPLDTPDLQKILTDSDSRIFSTKMIQEFENKCPNLAKNFKSDGQKLSNQFYNYPGIILIGLLGIIYVNFI